MGSARVSNTKPMPLENDNKKTFKTFIKSIFHKKKDKKLEIKETATEKETNKTKSNDEICQQTQGNKTQNANPLALILESFQKLELHKNTINDNEDNGKEIDNFTFKVIKVEKNNDRIQSQSSEDSGYSENKEVENVDKSINDDKSDPKVENVDKTEEITGGLGNLAIDDKKKKKRVQIVYVARGPTRVKNRNHVSSTPYPAQESDSYRQINQVNKQTLTGGKVIVAQSNTLGSFSEVDIALRHVENQSHYYQGDRDGYLQDIIEYINEDTNKQFAQSPTPEYIRNDCTNKQLTQLPTPEYIQNDCTNKQFAQLPTPELIQNECTNKQFAQLPTSEYIQNNCTNKQFAQLPTPEHVQNDKVYEDYELDSSEDQFLNELFQDMPQNTAISSVVERETLNSILFSVDNDIKSQTNEGNIDYIFPTPPRSENVLSPMLESPSSFYPPSSSECTLSPERSPIYNSDYEKYQVIPNFEEEKDTITRKAPKRNSASMSMKNFRDLQKEIACNFSKRECCQINRKSCKEIFQARFEKLKPAERKNLCFKVSKLDMRTSFGVLHHILLSLSRETEQEDYQYAMFGLVCVHILARAAALFAGDAGLGVLKAAALRCPHRPVLTRYLVQYIRTAINTDAKLTEDKDAIFHEVDSLGDTLVIACARAGDCYGDVLAELVHAEPGQPPLFRTHHTNNDGYTALHVACSLHSATSSHLHCVHVLLQHAGHDLWKGDVKGGDTALHLAVNSATCDLQLVMLMFKHVDRKLWKNLAHCNNMSSVTPIEYARAATKSTTRQNYPHEVLEFLKKCR